MNHIYRIKIIAFAVLCTSLQAMDHTNKNSKKRKLEKISAFDQNEIEIIRIQEKEEKKEQEKEEKKIIIRLKKLEECVHKKIENGKDINKILFGCGINGPVLMHALYNSVNNNGETTPYLKNILESLINKKANPNIKHYIGENVLGSPLLHSAIDYNVPATTIAMLLEKKCDPNQKIMSGNSPLHKLVNEMYGFTCNNEIEKYDDKNNLKQQNYYNCFKTLLQHNANYTLTNQFNETVFHFIAQKNRLDLANLLYNSCRTNANAYTLLVLHKKKMSRQKTAKMHTTTPAKTINF